MKGKSKAKGMVLHLALAMTVLTIGLAIAVAKLILSGSIGEEKLGICACVIAGLTALLLCLYCSLRMPQKKLLWGMLTAGCYATALLLGNLLFFGVGYGEVLPVLGSVFAAGFLGSFLAAIRRRKYA